jgi:hypothetical protein
MGSSLLAKHYIVTGRKFLTLMFLSLGVLLLTIGCEPEATPIAIITTPTATPIPEATIPPPIRYALADNVEGFMRDREQIEAVAIVEQLGDDGRSDVVAESYDMVVSLGIIEGWQIAPQRLRVGIAINTILAPLDDAYIIEALRSAFISADLVSEIALVGIETQTTPDTSAPTTIRTQLANMGFPDGFALRMGGDDILAESALISHLRQANFTLERSTTDSTSSAHLWLLLGGNDAQWSAWEAQYGAENILYLYDIPLSYRVKDNVVVDFTAHGFPIPQSISNDTLE